MDTSSKSKQTDTQEENEAAPSDEPSVDGEKEEKHLNSGNQSQSHVKNPSEDKPHGFALFSVEGSAPSVGGTLGPLTPRQQKSPGEKRTPLSSDKAQPLLESYQQHRSC